MYKRQGKYYGDWKTGVKGKGGKGVKISLTKGYTVSNTLTGNIKLSHSKLDLTLGYSTTETFNRTTSYSISAPKKNKTYTIKYRNVYKMCIRDSYYYTISMLTKSYTSLRLLYF